MDERREEREELAALERDAADGTGTSLSRRFEQEWPRVTDAKPYPKAQQLGRGAKRYRRKIASPKAWQAIMAAKIGPCRVCVRPASNGATKPQAGRYPLCFHHIVPRDFHGDDVAENIAPLCFDCHALVTARDPAACMALCASLTDAEYAYAVDKCGEGVFERVYGITYGR